MHGVQTKVGVQQYAAGAVIAGKYRLLHRLGQGGMGSIWAAHNPTLDINVALKLIRLDAASDDARARLLQEARATARLADPGIVRIFDVGHTERGDPFITMELLAGTNLRHVLDAGPLDAVRAVRTLLPIVRALECAHRGGIVHRDVKPENIVLALGTRGDVQPKLVDFGVAKILTRPNQLTSAGAAVGSPLYMSPEQARGEPIDARTDLWSICVVLYESIMGAPPFDATNSNALLHAIATQSAPTLAGRGACDETLSRIIDRGLSKRRDERWPHARDLMLALAAWLRSRGATDDITGLSLRGLTTPAPSPSPLAPDHAKGDPTIVHPLGKAALAPAGAAQADGDLDPGAADLRRAALAATASSVAPDRRTGALLWAALAFIGLALVIMAMAFADRATSGADPPLQAPAPPSTASHTAATPPAAAPSAPGASPSAPVQPLAESTTPPASAPRAPRPPSAPARTSPPTPHPPSRGTPPAPSHAPPPRRTTRPDPATPTKPARPPQRTPAPFKNPFD